MQSPHDPDSATGNGGPSGHPGPGTTGPTGTPAGMGSAPRGPAFLPWTAAGSPPAATGPSTAGPSAPARAAWTPPRSRWPGLISLLAVLVVAGVVAAATLSARYADTHIAAPSVTAAPSQPPPVASQPGRIEFTTDRGTGELILTSHRWTTDGTQPPASGSYLRVEVELVCHSGVVDYGPYDFQVFDQSGQLYELATEGASEPLLGTGRLHADEHARGMLAFDVPRGEITLLMNDDTSQNVTALKVPD